MTKETRTACALAVGSLLLLATETNAGFEVIEAHGLASAQIGDGPVILDEDWSMPLEVSAFAAGPEGIVAGTGSTFDIGHGFTGLTTAQANSWIPSPLLAAGTIMDFTFVVDSNIASSLSVDMMLMSNGDAFGSVSLLIQDLTDDMTLLTWQQSSGQTSIETMLDLTEGHTYQFVATSDGGVADGGVGSMTSTLYFQMLLPAPGALGLFGLACMATKRRRRR